MERENVFAVECARYKVRFRLRLTTTIFHHRFLGLAQIG
jgi:hypothetical protein